MNASQSYDKLAIQVQQNLFEYFYFHNKTNLEGSFNIPKSCVPTARTSDCNQKLFSITREDSLSLENQVNAKMIHQGQNSLTDNKT